MLTKNENNVLRLIACSFGTHYSINQVAKECGLAPNGAYKILKKFEKEGILAPSKIANIKSYAMDFSSTKTAVIMELVLMPELEGRIKYRSDDLKELKEITKACIMFGSYIDLAKNPHDLDVLFVIDKKDYRKYKTKLDSVKHIMPAKIHDVIQTEEDLQNNIKKKDNVILSILRKGLVLWGQSFIIKVIENASKGQD